MTRPLRVLFLEPSAQLSGGGIALLRLISALDRKIFRPMVVLGSDGPLVRRFRRIPGCRVLCWPFRASLSAVTRFNVFTAGIGNVAPALGYGFKLRRLADRWRADIVHSNGLKMDLLSILIIRRRMRLLIWHIRDHISPPYMPRRSATLLRFLARYVPDLLICNSMSTRASLGGRSDAFVIESAIPIQPGSQRVHARRAGVALGADEATERRHRISFANRVLMLGRIAEWKGQHVFVRAARRLCEEDAATEFLIAGGATTAADSAYERQLISVVQSAGLSGRITFMGMVEDVQSLLRSVDLVAHCSVSPEPLGQVILEAMAASVPVVATDLGGPAEIIHDNVNGRLYPAGDDQALARILRELLRDPESGRRMAIAGRRTVEERFPIHRTVEKLCEIYREYAMEAPQGRGVDRQ